MFSYGLSVALPRAVLAIPGHMGFAVFMGVFYGRAKLLENQGDPFGSRWSLIWGYLAAVLLHGIYDSCCMTGTTLSTVIFTVFVIVMYIVVFRLIKRQAQTDQPI